MVGNGGAHEKAQLTALRCSSSHLSRAHIRPGEAVGAAQSLLYLTPGWFGLYLASEYGKNKKCLKAAFAIFSPFSTPELQ